MRLNSDSVRQVNTICLSIIVVAIDCLCPGTSSPKEGNRIWNFVQGKC